jgi:hypothetical protein
MLTYAEGQGGCGNPAAMLDKKRVAAWLKSINFDEYAARIIDYGYGSQVKYEQYE